MIAALSERRVEDMGLDEQEFWRAHAEVCLHVTVKFWSCESIELTARRGWVFEDNGSDKRVCLNHRMKRSKKTGELRPTQWERATVVLRAGVREGVVKLRYERTPHTPAMRNSGREWDR